MQVINKFSWQMLAILLTILLNTSFARSQGVWVDDSSTAVDPRYSFTSETISDKIYVIGGNPTYLTRTPALVQIFDPMSHNWSTPAFAGDSGIIFDQASVVIGDSIYIVGGTSGLLSDTMSLRIFDVLHNKLDTPSVSGYFTPRASLTASVVGGKIYAIGGIVLSNSSTALNILEVFNPASNAWSTPETTDTFTGRYALTSSVVNGKIYVIGGWPLVNFIEVFDTATMQWSRPATSGKFTPRENLTSSVVDGKIYVMGGDTGLGALPLNTFEMFDPATNSWSSEPAMPTPMSGFPYGGGRTELASTVWNGKIYAIGGYTPHRGLNTMEVFTSGTNAVNFGPNISSQVSAFPTPTPGPVTIRGAAGAVTVTNVLGEEVLPSPHPLPGGEGEVQLDLSKLPAGMYFIEVPGQRMVKIVKE